MPGRSSREVPGRYDALHTAWVVRGPIHTNMGGGKRRYVDICVYWCVSARDVVKMKNIIISYV
jgi:hypothetical protein